MKEKGFYPNIKKNKVVKIYNRSVKCNTIEVSK